MMNGKGHPYLPEPATRQGRHFLMLIDFAAITHPGKVRRNNEDAYLLSVLDGEEPIINAPASSLKVGEPGLLPADAVVVPSRFAAERLQQYGLTTPTWVISNGAHVLPRPRAARRERATPPYVLLCVGRLAPEKRQDVIIDAVARCRHRDQVRLVVAGAGHLEASLRARAEKRFNDVRQLSDSLIFDVHDAIQNLPGATPARKFSAGNHGANS